MKARIALATSDDAECIAELAVRLTAEIVEQSNAAAFDLDLRDTVERCRSYLASATYAVLVARHPQSGELVGMLAMSESHALYTEGPFGTVQELYVEPAWRSRGIGAAMVERARAYAHGRGWKRLELCTPPLPAFERTLSFYERNGFEVTGGRKMKCVLAP